MFCISITKCSKALIVPVIQPLHFFLLLYLGTALAVSVIWLFVLRGCVTAYLIGLDVWRIGAILIWLITVRAIGKLPELDEDIFSHTKDVFSFWTACQSRGCLKLRIWKNNGMGASSLLFKQQLRLEVDWFGLLSGWHRSIEIKTIDAQFIKQVIIIIIGSFL